MTRYGEASIGVLSGSMPRPARAVGAAPERAVLHLVMVHPHDGPKDRALCGLTPARGWVMLPAWPDRECPTCRARKAL